MTSRINQPTTANDAAIEQAIAKYGTVTRAAKFGGFPLKTVWKVWGRMCAIEAGLDKPLLLPCGTVAAYDRHVKASEEPCVPCKAAKTQANRMRSYRRQRKEKAA